MMDLRADQSQEGEERNTNHECFACSISIGFPSKIQIVGHVNYTSRLERAKVSSLEA